MFEHSLNNLRNSKKTFNHFWIFWRNIFPETFNSIKISDLAPSILVWGGAEASFGGLGGRRPPPLPQGKRKKKKRKKKKEKKRKKKKRKKRKKRTMNNVKLLHIKCCFFSNFSIVRWHWKIKKISRPQEKVEMTPLGWGLKILIWFYLQLTTSTSMFSRFTDPESWEKNITWEILWRHNFKNNTIIIIVHEFVMLNDLITVQDIMDLEKSTIQL